MASPSWAATARCPLKDGDACGEWRFELVDKDLAEVVAGATAWIDQRLPPHLREPAQTALTAAHSQWIQFRAAECRRKVAADVISARTKRGQMAGCLLDMTWRRLQELKQAYQLSP